MRTNDEWLRELRAGDAVRERALADLRAYLLSALPAGLGRRHPLPADLAEDVVQDALLRALDHLDRFEGRSRFTTWATSIAVRLALTELRRRRWRDVSLDDLTGPLDPPSAAPPDGSPESQAAQHGILAALQRALDETLTDHQRTAIVAELRGMPQEEIGRRLGISRNAVYKLGHDARKKLKAALEAHGLDADAIRAAYP